MSYHSGNQLIDPYELFEKAKMHSGMHIVDFGCGKTGHVVFPASKFVGEMGVVYAVDILKDMLELIKRRAAMEAILNIKTVWADIEREGGVAIAPKTIDVVFMVNVLFHFDDYNSSLNEAKRLLKSKGKIVVVDWQQNLAGIGPSTDKMVDFFKVEQWARKNNFVVQDNCGVGPYHRCMILFRA